MLCGPYDTPLLPNSGVSILYTLVWKSKRDGGFLALPSTAEVVFCPQSGIMDAQTDGGHP
ncbi:hypothetical protein HMPREF0239_04674 [Clostridium sp. ATCC BAA-442]|nr:hypothetical protein HMPREF0239_04674 [Clostridium sp. ATCC BAA-442]